MVPGRRDVRPEQQARTKVPAGRERTLPACSAAPDRNPLRRPSDRLESAALALLVIVFLAAAPFAALATAYGDPQAQARWTAHNGKLVTGEIFVPLDTTVGSTQQLWTTANGQPSTPPLEDSQVTGQAYFDEGFAVFALAILLTITGLITRWTLDKHRMTAWDTEWRTAGPHWTTRA